jgi:hypothetical protein
MLGIFCSAKCRYWPIRSDIAPELHVGFRGTPDTRHCHVRTSFDAHDPKATWQNANLPRCTPSPRQKATGNRADNSALLPVRYGPVLRPHPIGFTKYRSRRDLLQFLRSSRESETFGSGTAPSNSPPAVRAVSFVALVRRQDRRPLGQAGYEALFVPIIPSLEPIFQKRRSFRDLIHTDIRLS